MVTHRKLPKKIQLPKNTIPLIANYLKSTNFFDVPNNKDYTLTHYKIYERNIDMSNLHIQLK